MLCIPIRPSKGKVEYTVILMNICISTLQKLVNTWKCYMWEWASHYALDASRLRSRMMNLIYLILNISHNNIWRYPKDDRNEEAVIQWEDLNNLALLHDNKIPASFNSGRWCRGYNPDLIFLSDHIIQQCVKVVCPPSLNSQHWPIMYQAVVSPLDIGITLKKLIDLHFRD